MSTQDIWVVYCAENQQFSIRFAFQENLTAMQAIQISGLLEQTDLPEPLHMGVFSLKIDNPEEYIVQAGDRLEIYRPLKMNPKEVRRLRAKRNPVGQYMRGNQWKRHQKSTD